MNIICFAFRQFLKSVWSDFMLAACLFAPIFMGLFFKIGVPILEQFLFKYFNTTTILTPYYPLFDLLLSYMTPLMLSFSGIMVILEELDDGTAKYLFVTPLGKRGYFISRIGILTCLSILYNVILLAIFSLSDIPWYHMIIAAFLNAIFSIIIAMMVIAFAKNKVEGMALVKLSGFMIVGFLAAFFMKTPLGYIAGILPSFWMGRLIFDSGLLAILPCVGISFAWMVLLNKKFKDKIAS